MDRRVQEWQLGMDEADVQERIREGKSREIFRGIGGIS
jgi:hypothetical protein